MAEWTPNLRASYDAAETTPRSSRWPPTTTALPLSEGLKSSSTETKNASISTWKMVLACADIRGTTGDSWRILSATWSRLLATGDASFQAKGVKIAVFRADKNHPVRHGGRGIHAGAGVVTPQHGAG